MDPVFKVFHVTVTKMLFAVENSLDDWGKP